MNKMFGEENETKTKSFKGAQVLWPKEIPDDIFKDVKIISIEVDHIFKVSKFESMMRQKAIAF